MGIAKATSSARMGQTVEFKLLILFPANLILPGHLRAVPTKTNRPGLVQKLAQTLDPNTIREKDHHHHEHKNHCWQKGPGQSTSLVSQVHEIGEDQSGFDD